jgi:uncharacterized protein YfcZ (UPF0381/DUF406 family)
MEAAKNLGVEFRCAAVDLGCVLRGFDGGREVRIEFLRRTACDALRSLDDAKKLARELPEQIAKWEAEIAHLEAGTGIDLVRELLANEVKP